LFSIIWASHFPSPHDPNKVFPGSKRNPGNVRGTDRNRRVYDFLTSGLPYLPHLVSKPSKQQKRVSLVPRRDILKQKEKSFVCMTREGPMEAQWIADRAALQQTRHSRPQASLSER